MDMFEHQSEKHTDAPGCIKKKRLKPAQYREYGGLLQLCYSVSERWVCRVLQCPRSVYWYSSIQDEQAALRIRIRDIAQVRVSYGYRRTQVLLRREGWKVHHTALLRT